MIARSAPIPLRLLAFGLAASVAAPALSAQAEIIPVPLTYNFNGIVHAGEASAPDDPDGFRSISDRGLDFKAGVPDHPLLEIYTLVDQPGVLDLVHVGNRDLVAGGSHAFDDSADGDSVGIQPNWLSNVDQSTPQSSTLTPPIVIPDGDVTTFSFLYHISNGGGAFEVELDFVTGFDITLPVSGTDWFNGDFAGTGSVDQAVPNGDLKLQEFDLSLEAYAGDQLQRVTFQSPDSSDSGIAVFAATLLSADAASNTLRTDGANVSSYLTTTRPVLGRTYRATVDLANTTGHDFVLIVGTEGQANIPLPSGLVVLVDPFHPTGEVLGFSAKPGPIAIFETLVPSDLSFAGFTFTSQAVHAGGAVGGFSLSNAYDHVLGL